VAEQQQCPNCKRFLVVPDRGSDFTYFACECGARLGIWQDGKVEVQTSDPAEAVMPECLYCGKTIKSLCHLPVESRAGMTVHPKTAFYARCSCGVILHMDADPDIESTDCPNGTLYDEVYLLLDQNREYDERLNTFNGSCPECGSSYRAKLRRSGSWDSARITPFDCDNCGEALVFVVPNDAAISPAICSSGDSEWQELLNRLKANVEERKRRLAESGG
jgi:hypothetical protein